MQQKKQTRIDLVDICTRAFKDIWESRQVLAKLAVFPIAIKVMSFMVIVFSGLQDNLLRQGLLFIPSYFVEGWFVAVAIRMVLFQEKWPFFLTGDTKVDGALIARRRNAIHSCGILYTLFKLISVVFVALVLTGQGGENFNPEGLAHIQDDLAASEAASGVPAIVTFVLASVGLFVTLWSFRYFCMYAAAAMGVHPIAFLKSCKGLVSSFHLLFISMFCFVPFFVIFSMIDSVVRSAFPNAELSVEQLGYSVVFSVEQSIMETVVALVTAIALAYMVSDMMNKKAKK